MMTTLDIVDILWSRADGSSLKSSINGSLCKHRRDPNSTKEDIVFNCLPVNGEQLSKAIANVNVFVPDIEVEANGQIDKQPNHTRLKALASEAVGIYKENWTADLNYSVQQQVLIADPDSGCHYINIRIEFFIENL